MSNRFKRLIWFDKKTKYLREKKVALHMDRLNGLQPAFKKKALEVISGMEKCGWNISIVFGKRTKAQNDALGKNASKASLHLIGKAVDIIDTTVQYNIAYKNFAHPFCKDLEQLCIKHGVYWGGNFVRKNPKYRWDPCHFQAK